MSRFFQAGNMWAISHFVFDGIEPQI